MIKPRSGALTGLRAFRLGLSGLCIIPLKRSISHDCIDMYRGRGLAGHYVRANGEGDGFMKVSEGHLLDAECISFWRSHFQEINYVPSSPYSIRDNVRLCLLAHFRPAAARAHWLAVEIEQRLAVQKLHRMGYGTACNIPRGPIHEWPRNKEGRWDFRPEVRRKPWQHFPVAERVWGVNP